MVGSTIFLYTKGMDEKILPAKPEEVLDLFKIDPVAQIPPQVAFPKDFQNKDLKISRPAGINPSDVEELKNAASSSIETLLSVIQRRDIDVMKLANELGVAMAERSNAAAQLETIRAVGVEVTANELGVDRDELKLANSLRETKENWQRLQAKHKNLTAKYKRLEEDYEKLNTWAHKKDTQNKDLKEQLQRANLGGLSEKLESDTQNLEKAKQLYEVKIKELEQANQQLSRQIEEIQSAKTVGDDIAVLTRELDEARARIQTQQDRLDEYIRFTKENEKWAKDVEIAMNRLESENEKLKAQLSKTGVHQEDNAPMPSRGDSLPLGGELPDDDPMPSRSDSLPLDDEPMPSRSDSLPLDDELPTLNDGLSDDEPMPSRSDSLPLDNDPDNLPLDDEPMPSRGDSLPLDDELPTLATLPDDDPMPSRSDSLPVLEEEKIEIRDDKDVLPILDWKE